MTLSEKIREAGVTGAGGAGFPTHIKASSSVEYVAVNGAECEPLIHKDYELMVHHAETIVRGVKLMIQSTGAKKAFFGIKAKNQKAIESVEKFIKNEAIEMTQLGDFYPSGDEYELVYEATGRLIPPAGIPLQVGCVVNNVETFYNIARADEGVPLTEKFLCVNGAVRKPSAFFVPIGISYREVIEAAGGITVPEYGVFAGGVMMGELALDLDSPVTKASAGFIILPKKHNLIRRKMQPEKSRNKIGKSACDQCSYCTEFCPRYLLGYNVQPHKVMRSLGFTKTGNAVWNQMAELCCACGLCTLYSCPEDLFPKEACDTAKREMRAEGVRFVQEKPPHVHPMKSGRRVPLRQLIARLNLHDYDVHTPYTEIQLHPQSVTLLLKQHIGAPAVPIISEQARVKKGDLLAKPPEGALGSYIHASIDGTVTKITAEAIHLKA